MMKKCLILDLDNTLWGGVAGEDGASGIKLDLSPSGGGYIAFQQVILDLYNRGVILAINSKNNFDDAIAIIRSHPNMILKENHFSAMRINWQEKAENIREIAKELNIGTDSMVFLDDDRVNRLAVKVTMPEVEVPDLPEDPGQYAKFLMNLPYFDTTVITDEDKMRGNLYVTERLRKEMENGYGASREGFLADLKIELRLCEDDATNLARLAQLTEKTNQFNTNKRPLTEKDIADFVSNKDYKIFYGQARDKFGDYGIVAFALVDKKENRVWKVDSLLMSCRALGRGIEESFVASIAEKARRERVEEMLLNFVETEKNMPAKNFYEKYFNERAVDCVLKKLKDSSGHIEVFFENYGKE